MKAGLSRLWVGSVDVTIMIARGAESVGEVMMKSCTHTTTAAGAPVLASCGRNHPGSYG
jgi:hypothetical protein